jgi:hypothetical protein
MPARCAGIQMDKVEYYELWSQVLYTQMKTALSPNSSS